MPYTDGLGKAIAAPRSSLAMRIAQLRLARKVAPKKVIGHGLFRPLVTPVLKLPVTGPAVVPIAPTVITAQSIPYSASGGGPVTSGAPSPVMSTTPDEQVSAEAPAQAGMSPIVMLLLAGTAVAFLLKKKR